MDFFTKNNYDNFKNNGYILLTDYFTNNSDSLEDITQFFSNLPETKNKYMKYYETIGEKRILSRMEYLLEFNDKLRNMS